MSIKAISSRDNPQYKHIRQLAGSSQARKKSGQTLLEGIHLCQAWLQHKGVPELCIVGEAASQHPEVASLLMACEAQQVPCLQIPEAMFAPLSQVEHGIALLFVIATPASTATTTLDAPALLLDGLQDPGNLGSILRSAAAAGIPRVFCSASTVFAWSPKVLRAGMGAHFMLEIIEDADLITLTRDASLPVFATSSHAASSIYQADLAQPSAWLFGHEGRGVSDELLALATQELTIPQQTQIESLNVAASVAVCLFEQVRQLQIVASILSHAT